MFQVIHPQGVSRRRGSYSPGLFIDHLLRSSGPLLAVLCCLGCYATGGQTRSGIDDSQSDQEIQAEAYSFNARLRRDGKPTTFKLEVYQTDTRLGLSGRGYLGKGALKGWLSSDSLKVYFPSTKELLYESHAKLVKRTDCPLPLADLDVLRLFRNLPDSLELSGDVVVSADYSNSKRPKFQIVSVHPDCDWSVDLIYDHQQPGWRIRQFEFSDGQNTTLKGTRERYKASARVPFKRFQIEVPPGTSRISP